MGMGQHVLEYSSKGSTGDEGGALKKLYSFPVAYYLCCYNVLMMKNYWKKLALPPVGSKLQSCGYCEFS